MAGKTTVLSTAYVNAYVARTAPSQQPVNSYIALLSTNPSDNTMAGAVETPYTGYTAASSRQSIVNSSTGWNAPSGSNTVTTTNKLLLTFPTASGAGSITGIALCGDNSTAITTAGATTGTNYWNSISTQTVNNGNPVTIAAGAFTLGES